MIERKIEFCEPLKVLHENHTPGVGYCSIALGLGTGDLYLKMVDETRPDKPSFSYVIPQAEVGELGKRFAEIGRLEEIQKKLNFVEGEYRRWISEQEQSKNCTEIDCMKQPIQIGAWIPCSICMGCGEAYCQNCNDVHFCLECDDSIGFELISKDSYLEDCKLYDWFDKVGAETHEEAIRP